MVASAIDALGRLDFLVNNAGTPATPTPIPFSDLDALTEEFWSTILTTNLIGPFRCAHAAVPALKAARGAICNTASIAGVMGSGSSIPYATSKAGLINLTRSLARTLAPEIRVNAVAPGFVDSPWNKDWPVDRKQTLDRAHAVEARLQARGHCRDDLFSVRRGGDDHRADSHRRWRADALGRNAGGDARRTNGRKAELSEARSMNGAQWLARALAGTGMTHVFFVESVMRRTLLEFEDLGVTRILAHSEKAAAYMADGYARIAGRPGVCMAQSVGAANLASGLAGRLSRAQPGDRLDRAQGALVPAPQRLSGNRPRAAVRCSDQSFRRRSIRPPSCRACCATPGARQWPTPRARPISISAACRATSSNSARPPSRRSSTPRRGSIPAHRPVADERDIERAAAALSAARRVAIVAGDGAAASQAGPEVLALAEALAAPVATALGARGIIPTRHPLSAGVPGSYSAPPANRIVHGADLVLYVGCDTGDQVTLNWTRAVASRRRIVQIDADPLEIGRSYPNTIGLVGDPKATVARLVQAIGRPARDRGFAEEAARIVADWRSTMAPLVDDDRAPIRVERLCAEITKALPADGILVADTGYSGIWTGTMIDFNGAGQTYLRAAGSLGWSFPASLGAQCAAPNRAVLCFTGDGGFYYHLAELESARRCGIAAVVVVNNNSGLWPEPDRGAPHRRQPAGPRRGAGALWPDRFHRGREELWRARHPGRAARPRSHPHSAEALGAGEPVVVDVVTDLEPRAPEPWSPGARA